MLIYILMETDAIITVVKITLWIKQRYLQFIHLWFLFEMYIVATVEILEKHFLLLSQTIPRGYDNYLSLKTLKHSLCQYRSYSHHRNLRVPTYIWWKSGCIHDINICGATKTTPIIQSPTDSTWCLWRAVSLRFALNDRKQTCSLDSRLNDCFIFKFVYCISWSLSIFMFVFWL